MRRALVAALFVVACGGGSNEPAETEASNGPSAAGATSGDERTTAPSGDCAQLDPWAASGTSTTPCTEAQGASSQPVLDPFEGQDADAH